MQTDQTPNKDTTRGILQISVTSQQESSDSISIPPSSSPAPSDSALSPCPRKCNVVEPTALFCLAGNRIYFLTIKSERGQEYYERFMNPPGIAPAAEKGAFIKEHANLIKVYNGNVENGDCQPPKSKASGYPIEKHYRQVDGTWLVVEGTGTVTPHFL